MFSYDSEPQRECAAGVYAADAAAQAVSATNMTEISQRNSS